MDKKIIFALCFVILLIGIAGASLGTFKQGDCVQIKTILNSTQVNISSLSYPDSTIAITEQPMTKVGSTFNLTFCNTTDLGTYVYDYNDELGDVYVNDFKITPSGKEDTGANIVFTIFLIIMIYAITFIGVFSRNATLTVLGGGIMIFLGVYLINNGIIIYRDDLTIYFSYLTSFIGAFLSVWGGIEVIQENM